MFIDHAAQIFWPSQIVVKFLNLYFQFVHELVPEVHGLSLVPRHGLIQSCSYLAHFRPALLLSDGQQEVWEITGWDKEHLFTEVALSGLGARPWSWGLEDCSPGYSHLSWD